MWVDIMHHPPTLRLMCMWGCPLQILVQNPNLEVFMPQDGRKPSNRHPDASLGQRVCLCDWPDCQILSIVMLEKQSFSMFKHPVQIVYLIYLSSDDVSVNNRSQWTVIATHVWTNFHRLDKVTAQSGRDYLCSCNFEMEHLPVCMSVTRSFKPSQSIFSSSEMQLLQHCWSKKFKVSTQTNIIKIHLQLIEQVP